uniref:Latent-transforming growth factor beta-binding protein 4 n=1 Tax=Amazona collaria TaxID=241587 RepID=A0A8B9GK13_9PSIT
MHHAPALKINECTVNPDICGAGHCVNLPVGYTCICYEGYRLNDQQTKCSGMNGSKFPSSFTSADFDECARPHTCGEGYCINTVGSYRCEYCDNGYQMNRRGECDDIDECLTPTTCPDAQCINAPGSYQCIPCRVGFRGWNGQCHDIDECQYGNLCTNGHCENTEGSFRCICGQGFKLSASEDQCEDIDECQHRSLCTNGHCRNTEGSFRCICSQGYTLSFTGDQCEDVDECLQDSDICLRGNCINTDGSYKCTCPDGFQQIANRGCQDINECERSDLCSPHGECLNTDGSYQCICERGFSVSADGRRCEEPDEHEDGKKECYYNLNDANFCDNVLTSNVTKQECCCTLGAGWGDNCEIFPCPVFGTAEFSDLCPEGKAFNVYSPDADECQLFGQEICKNGFCLNTQPGYECYCKQGTYYDPVKLQCQHPADLSSSWAEAGFCCQHLVFDTDECQDPNSCIDGQCINTEGSYNCFCTHPMVLDSTENDDLILSSSPEQTEETEVYQDLCWQHLSDDFVCSRPLVGKQTTYTECCCLYGEAWGMQCALCPMKESGKETYMSILGLKSEILNQFNLLHLYLGFLNSFEELQAEECGILNGCENGRCVRVQEGYTCDCFDGYHLDMAKMTCVDVNECNELNNRMSLCKNAKCINTEGSYKCLCLPGYVPSDKPNYCTPLNSELYSELE